MAKSLSIATCALMLFGITNSAYSQFRNLGDEDGGLFLRSSFDEPEVAVSLTRSDEQPVDEVTLRIRVNLPADHYTYSLSPNSKTRTEIEITQTVGLVPLDDDFQPNRAPKSVFDAGFRGIVEQYFHDVTWQRRYRIQPAGRPGTVSIHGVLNYQVCNKVTCTPLKHPFEASYTADASAGVRSNAGVSDTFQMEHERQFGGKAGPVRMHFRLSPENAKAGDVVTVSIVAELDPKWHVYSLTQPPDNAAEATEITMTQTANLKAADAEFRPLVAPEITHPLDDIVQEIHEKTVTWTRRFTVEHAGPYGIVGTIRYQVCDDRRCLPSETVSFTLGHLGNGSKHADTNARMTIVPDVLPLGNDGKPSGTGELEIDVQEGGLAVPQRLFAFLIAAMAAGFAALLTPCVFPMVPITVSFFLKQAEKEHHKPVSTALIYCSGIIITFTALGLIMAALFGATSINELANNGWLNLAIAGVLVFFGLNLLGLFEIRIPGWLLTWTAGKETKGGFIGTLFMSLTFTLTSFTCTFAFAGAILVWAADGNYYWPILGMLAFATAFSLPFFFLALFPSFLKSLPTSGGWMNTVKVTMGLVEMGAAFKFLSVADFVWHPNAWFFDYALVMSAWMIISICGGLYLLGMFRLPHDTASDHIGVARLVFAMTFLGLASYLAVGLFGPEKPTGKIWENIASFAPPRFEAGEDEQGPYHEHGGLKYSLDFNRAMQYARQRQLPVFIDFTGVNCTNCRKMEGGPMSKPHVTELLKDFVRVQLYVDRVPTIRDEALAQQLKETNQRLQEKFGNVGLPTYFLITPEQRPTILGRFEGMELVDGDFAEFLDRGLERWAGLQQMGRVEQPAQPDVAIR